MSYYFTNITLIFIALSIQCSLAVGSCVTFQHVNTTMYRVPRLVTILWTAQVLGCNVVNWNVHYDSTSPVRIFQNKTETTTTVNSTFVPVTPSFDYEVYIEAQTNSGQIVRSSKVTYSAPKDKPTAAPSRLHATSIKHDSIALAWEKVDLLHKNGDVKGYRIAYRDASTGAVKYVTVVGEDSVNTTLIGLQPKHTYQIMIQCINDIGGGPYSSPMLTITLPEPPTTTTTTSTTTTTVSTTSTTVTTTTTSTTSSATTTTTPSTTLTTKLTTPAATSTTATTRTTNISTAKAVKTPTTLSTTPAMTTIRPTQTTNTPTAKTGKTPATTTSTTTTSSKSSMLPGTTYSTTLSVKQTTFKPRVSDRNTVANINGSTTTAVTTNSLKTKKTSSDSTSQTQNIVSTTHVIDHHGTSTTNLHRPSQVTKASSISDVTDTDTSESKENDGGLPTWAIIAIALGSALILFSIILCCCCCPRCCAKAAVASKRDDKDKERVFRRQKMDNKSNCSKPDAGRRARNYSGISLESVDDEDLDYDEYIPYRQHRHPSIDSQVPLTAPVKLSHAKMSRKSKKSEAKSMPPLTNVGITTGTQYNEPVSVGTQCSDRDTMSTRRSGILSPGFPIMIETSRPVTNIGNVSRQEKGIQMTPLTSLTNESSLPLGASALGGLSNFDSAPSTRHFRKTIPFNCKSRGTSPGLPIAPMTVSRGTSPNILTQPSFGSHSRGTSPIREILPLQKPAKAPSSNDSFPSHKIEHNLIYKSHVNNTDNTFIQNIYNPRRNPPTPKPPRSVIQEHAQTPRGLYDSLLDNEKESKRMITPGSDRPTFFNNIPKLDVPIPRASVVERKKDWSEC